ncbi:MAG: sulfotransferase [bacterium]|nr:sulfotransferase [Candidatus Sumerlaeota bacterium]
MTPNLSVIQPEAISPVYVVGVARSGTTLIQQMLDHHPSLAFPWESHFIEVIHKKLPCFGDLSVPENRHKLILAMERYQKIAFGEMAGSEWIPGLVAAAGELAQAAPPSYAGVIATVYDFHARQRNRPRWGDKTPGYVNCLPLIIELFPKAKIIHMIRDGRDVAVSLMSLSLGPHTAYMSAVRWKQWVRHGLASAELHPDSIFQLRYEDLTEDPERYLRDVCAFIGEDYVPEMLEFHRDAKKRVPQGIHAMINVPANKSRHNRWKTELTPTQVRIIEAVAGDLLEQLGYERAFPDARLGLLDKRLGKMGDKLLRLRPNTKPHSLIDRISKHLDRARFDRNPAG